VFGGWGLEDCGQKRPCYRHRNDVWALDLSTMNWVEIDVNAEQPLPYKRKGHSVTLYNGSQRALQLSNAAQLAKGLPPTAPHSALAQCWFLAARHGRLTQRPTIRLARRPSTQTTRGGWTSRGSTASHGTRWRLLATRRRRVKATRRQCSAAASW